MNMLGSGVLIILGLGVFGAVANAVLFKKAHIPQVLGYMAAGIILGESGFGLITRKDIAQLAPINLFCLAVIGFLVGSEIRFSTLKKYFRQFSAILLGEGVTAFLLVSAGVTGITWLVAHDLKTAVSVGLVFGAIASATDPASTIAVLWEYRAAGILTTTVTAIVALDDGLAMTLYGVGSGLAQIISGHEVNVALQIRTTVVELFGSILLGVAVGLLLQQFLKRMTTGERTFISTIGLLLLVTGICDTAGMDIILAAMAAGITVANREPAFSKNLLERVRGFSAIIYIIFFVFVGARMQLAALPSWLWWIVAVYVAGRTLGKMGGAWLGARISGSDRVLQKYCGTSLMAQGGVAIGLSIMAGHNLAGTMVADGLSMGDTIIFGVTTTTFIVQLIGPPLVKLSIRLAGEMNRNVTEEDVLKETAVRDIALPEPRGILPSTPLREIFEEYSQNRLLALPVIDETKKLLGSIDIGQLKELIINRETWDWVIAEDITRETAAVIDAARNALQAVGTMKRLGTTELFVVDGTGRLTGALDQSCINRLYRTKLVEERT